MDDIIKDVNEGWDEGRRAQFKGSDDYLRQKVREMATSDNALDTNPSKPVRGVYNRSPCIDQTHRFRREG